MSLRLAQASGLVEHDRADDQNADDGPLPEVRYSEDGRARLMVNSRKAPNAAPQSVPLPPKMATPPITAAPTALAQEAKTRLGIDCAVTGGVAPASPADAPLTRNATKTRWVTFSP